MFAVLRRRNFALLWIGQMISLIGDWVLIVALPFYVYQLTGSVLQTGIMFIVETVPRIILGSITGVFVDRWNRRWTMIASDLLRAIVLLLLLFVHTPALLWLLYTVSLIQSVVSQFFTPAMSALTPTLVNEQQLLAANSLQSFTDAITRLVGPPLGGALLAILGLSSVVFIDSASYVFSALMVLLILLPKAEATSGVKATSVNAVIAKVWNEWLDGLRVVSRSQVISGIFLSLSVVMIAEGLLNVLLIVFVKQNMHGNALVFGWLITAQGVGSLLGALLVGQVSKFVKPSYLSAVALAVAGAVILIIVNMPNLVLALSLIVLVGLFVVGLFVSSQTLLQSGVEDAYRGRIFGAFSTTLALTTTIGIVIGSSLGDSLGAVFLLDIAGVLFFVAAIIALVMLRNARLVQPSAKEREPAVEGFPSA
jgi:MFS family permease